jgi:DDE superfamily endonuclease
MEACLKILTIVLPNGMTAAVYGPTSGREEDKTLFRMAQFDDFLKELCEEYHNSMLYSTYGDGIFAGYWYCLRTSHQEAPNMSLTNAQKDQNENMKSARQCIELSYGKAESLWPMLNQKDGFRLNVNPERVFAEIRVMFLLNNFHVCCLEGSTMTGQRYFRCPPPTLQEYLAMRDRNN